MKIFISYAREDESVARRLHDSLSGMPGVLPWLDTIHLLPGDDWQECINDAMEDSRLIVVLLSSNSVNKNGFVQKEIRTALDLSEEKPPGQCFIIPARIEFCDPRFRQIRKLQWVDLFVGWDEGITKIHTVKVLAPHYYEYLHLVKIDKKWVIVNALYENKSPIKN